MSYIMNLFAFLVLIWISSEPAAQATSSSSASPPTNTTEITNSTGAVPSTTSSTVPTTVSPTVSTISSTVSPTVSTTSATVTSTTAESTTELSTFTTYMLGGATDAITDVADTSIADTTTTTATTDNATATAPTPTPTATTPTTTVTMPSTGNTGTTSTSTQTPTTRTTATTSTMTPANTATSTQTPTSTSAATSPKECEKPASMANGIVTPDLDMYSPGSKVTYSCNDDYVTLCTSPTATCTSIGVWDYGSCLPACQKRSQSKEGMNPYVIPVVAIVAGVVGLGLILLLIGCICFHWYDCFRRKESAPKHKSITDLPPTRRSVNPVSMYQLDDDVLRVNSDRFKQDASLFQQREDEEDTSRESTIGSSEALATTNIDAEPAQLEQVVVDSNGPNDTVSGETNTDMPPPHEPENADTSETVTDVAAKPEVSEM